jgi:GPH family glycoside/pentoside/hexuronide:cation symporter
MSTYNRLSNKEKISYGVAGFGQNMLFTFVSTFMLVYLYEGVGFSTAGIATLTIILTFTKIWDAANDLIMGVVVDHTRTRWGKLRPYILFTAAPIALLTILMFAVPDMIERYQLVYIAVLYILWDMAYTMCDVPYWGLTGALSSDTKERTGLISLARTTGTIALALITLLGPQLARWLSFSDEITASGWTYAAAIVSILGMGLFTLAFFNTRERIVYKPEKTSIKQSINTIFHNKPLILILTGTILGFGRSIVQVGGAVVAVIVFGDEGIFTILGAAIIIGIAISTIATPFVLKKISKKTLVIASNSISFVVYILMYFLGYHSLITVFTMILMSGLMTGFFTVSQTAMIADSVDYIEYKTGERNEGVCFSGLTFVGKLMGAIATMVFGIAVATLGYSKGADITPFMKNGIYFTITIIPAISCLLGIIPFLFYNLSEKTLEEMMTQIMERRNKSI